MLSEVKLSQNEQETLYTLFKAVSQVEDGAFLSALTKQDMPLMAREVFNKTATLIQAAIPIINRE